MTGCIILGGVGLLSADKIHLPSVERKTIFLVFVLVGATFFAEKINTFGFAVLSGRRRFELINLIASLASIMWAIAVVALLIMGGGVVGVAICQLAVAVLKNIVTLPLVARLTPGLRFRPGFFKWNALRQHVSFALSSLFMDAMGSISWNSGSVLIGFISGSAAAVPFYIGQKFLWRSRQ